MFCFELNYDCDSPKANIHKIYDVVASMPCSVAVYEMSTTMQGFSSHYWNWFAPMLLWIGWNTHEHTGAYRSSSANYDHICCTGWMNLLFHVWRFIDNGSLLYDFYKYFIVFCSLLAAPHIHVYRKYIWSWCTININILYMC